MLPLSDDQIPDHLPFYHALISHEYMRAHSRVRSQYVRRHFVSRHVCNFAQGNLYYLRQDSLSPELSPLLCLLS